MHVIYMLLCVWEETTRFRETFREETTHTMILFAHAAAPAMLLALLSTALPSDDQHIAWNEDLSAVRA